MKLLKFVLKPAKKRKILITEAVLRVPVLIILILWIITDVENSGLAESIACYKEFTNFDNLRYMLKGGREAFLGRVKN
jgi:hypothetical protein